MKKKFVLMSLSAIALVAVAGCGCQKDQEAEITAEDETTSTAEVVPYEEPANASPITGLACDNYNKRTFAIMYSGDSETRPYFSNITNADFVVEMPHRATHGGTRVMGVFGCSTPEQVGPMRSGRVEFASIADSLKSVFVSWGGDATVKSLMNRGLFDNFSCADGGVNAGSAACYRLDKSVVPLDLEDRAFTSVPALITAAGNQGYSSENTFEGFAHQGETAMENRPEYGRLTVGYDNPFRVHYEYNPETNSYERLFNDEEEYDFVTKERVAPKNIIIIQTKKDAFYLDTDYVAQGLLDPWDTIDETEVTNDDGAYPNFQLGDPWFDTVFEGTANFYMNGQEIIGTWKKAKGSGTPFEFYDANGEEIHFVPGQIWMQVTMNGKTVKWNVGTDEDRAEEKAEREQPETETETGVVL